MEHDPRLGREPAPAAARVKCMPMEKPAIYEIRVEGQLSQGWSDWFDGLDVQPDPNGETTICGPLTDQAALFGVLAKIHALNLALVSVNRSFRNE